MNTEMYLEKKRKEVAELEKQLKSTYKIIDGICSAELKKLERDGWSITEPQLEKRKYHNVKVVVTSVQDYGSKVEATLFVTSGELAGMTLNYVVTKANMYTLKFRFQVDDEITLYVVTIDKPTYKTKKSAAGWLVHKIDQLKTKRVQVRKSKSWK